MDMPTAPKSQTPVVGQTPKVVHPQFFHPVQLTNFWCKHQTTPHKHIIRAFFKDFFVNNWDLQFCLVTSPKGLPLGSQQLVIPAPLYPGFKKTLEERLGIELKEFKFSKHKKSRKEDIIFKSKDEVLPFMEVIYANNKGAKLQTLRVASKQSLETFLDLLQEKETTLLSSLDFETYETTTFDDQGTQIRPLLEVGITTSIFNKSSNEFSKITTRHLIFKDHMFLRNGKYCADNRDNFGFGESETLPATEIHAILLTLSKTCDVFVFHNAGSESSTMKKLGIEMTAKIYDTQSLAHSLPAADGNLIGLGNLVSVLGLPATFMHNAGNDAHCTLSACIEILQRFKNGEFGHIDQNN